MVPTHHHDDGVVAARMRVLCIEAVSSDMLSPSELWPPVRQQPRRRRVQHFVICCLLLETERRKVGAASCAPGQTSPLPLASFASSTASNALKQPGGPPSPWSLPICILQCSRGSHCLHCETVRLCLPLPRTHRKGRERGGERRGQCALPFSGEEKAGVILHALLRALERKAGVLGSPAHTQQPLLSAQPCPSPS